MADKFTFERFVEAFENKVKEELGWGYKVSAIKVSKNNGLFLDGLAIKESSSDMAMPPACDRLNWDNIKDYIIIRLVNYDINKESFIKEEVPHKKVLGDLAVTFYVLLSIGKEGVQSFRINKQLFEAFAVDIDTVCQSALQNTAKFFNPTLRSMSEIITRMLAPKDMDNGYTELFDAVVPEKGREDMYVLSNETGFYGATTLLYPGILKEFAQAKGADLYILPSSLHEVILLPVLELDNNKEVLRNNLRSMVREINENQVAERDVLGNTVYMYQRSSDEIIIL